MYTGWLFLLVYPVAEDVGDAENYLYSANFHLDDLISYISISSFTGTELHSSRPD